MLITISKLNAMPCVRKVYYDHQLKQNVILQISSLSRISKIACLLIHVHINAILPAVISQ